MARSARAVGEVVPQHVNASLPATPQKGVVERMAKKSTEPRKEESADKSAAEPVIYVGGGKGGVGKSLMATAVVDFLLADEKKVHLIETDTSAPDVFKTYKDICESTQV